jgi:hypothetical protein
MKEGDLVKVFNSGFAAIGYISGKVSTDSFVVEYITILESDNPPCTLRYRKRGIWTKKHIKALKEVKKCP